MVDIELAPYCIQSFLLNFVIRNVLSWCLNLFVILRLFREQICLGLGCQDSCLLCFLGIGGTLEESRFLCLGGIMFYKRTG